MMMKDLELLGWRVRDRVTNFQGTVTHIGQDLYGCVQAIVQPEGYMEKGEQKTPESRWFDLSRLVKVGRSRVMEPVPVKGYAGPDNNKPVK